MTRGRKRFSARMICAIAMIFCAGLCAVILLLHPWASPQRGSGFSLHMIDVGQGDALLLVSNGKSMLIDGGPTDSSDALLAYLRAQKLTHLDYVILTHAHSDHYGGLRQVFEKYDVGLFLLPDSADTDTVYSFASWLCGKNDCDMDLISAGRSYVLGDSTVSVLSPAADAAAEDENDLSAVLLAEYGEYKFLLTGDASSALLETLDLPKIDVFKVAHHGSSDGTSDLLLSKTSPAHAFISCGAGNEYGHPQDACLRRLTEAGARVWRTDLSGNVVAAVTGDTLRITTSR